MSEYGTHKSDMVLPAEDILAGLNKPLPHSHEAERGILSCILQDPRRIRSTQLLPPMAFHNEAYRHIYDTVIEIYDEKTPLDPILVSSALRQRKLMDKIGGPSVLSEIFTAVQVAANFPHYHKIVLENYRARRQIHAFARCVDLLLTPPQGSNLDDVMETAKGILDEASHTPGQLLKSRHLIEVLNDVTTQIEYRMEHPGQLPGLTTGMAKLDKLTQGMQPQHVWVLAGEPGDGKSTLLQNMAESAAIAGAKVRWYPLEMPDTEQAFRMLCSNAMIDNNTLYSGLMTRGEQEALAASIRRLKQLGVHIVDVDGATATDIFNDIERSDCDIAVVDYLQLMEDQGRKNGTREELIAGISRRMKRLARRTNKTILTASQLNDNGKLRESRAIGQDADKVLIIQKAANKDGSNDDTKRNIYGAKNRGGKRDWSLPCQFNGSCFKFTELRD